jgi:hypothetical protein
MKWLDDLIVKYSYPARLRTEHRQYKEQEEKTMVAMGQSAFSLSQQAGIKFNSPGQLGISKSQRADFNRESSLNFTLHPAEGGYILEYNHYDQNTDRYTQRLHIINDSDNMGEAISKILTLELLRK